MTGHVKKAVIDAILHREGGYVNDPSDSGGETNHGITIAVARSYGYHGPMKNLPRNVAFDIYAAEYWDKLNLDYIENRSAGVAAEIADTGVNMGIKRAAVFLQRSLNALNDRGRLYPDISADGDIGPQTIRAFNSYMDARKSRKGVEILLKALNCLQGAYYIELAEKREKDEKFLAGWLSHRVS